MSSRISHPVGVRDSNIARRAFVNFCWTVLSTALGKGITFGANVYLARTLGVASFGFFCLVTSITMYAWLAADLGINMYAIRCVAGHKDNVSKLVSSLLTLKVAAGILVFILYCLCFCIYEVSITKRMVYLGSAIYLITYSFYADWVYKGLEKFKYIAFGSLLNSVVFLAGCFCLVSGEEDIGIASFLWSISVGVGGLVLLLFLSRHLGVELKPRVDPRNWWNHIKKSVYFMVSGGLMVLYQYLPLVALSVFQGPHELGLFSAPARLVMFVTNAGFLLPSALYPIFCQLFERDRGTLKKTHRYLRVGMALVGLTILAIGTFWSEQIMGLVFGVEYEESVRVFRILLWLVPLCYMRYTYGVIFMACQFQKFHNTCAAFGVMCCVIGCITLIPTWGVVGAGVAGLAAEVGMVVVLHLTFRWRVRPVLNEHHSGILEEEE